MNELAIRREFAEGERERLVDELARANRRLSGTLEIVLSTIDSGDVGVLFTRTMEQVCQTLEASAALLYLAEDGRLRLRGWSDDADPTRLPQRISPERLRMRGSETADPALRLRVLPPSREALRQGGLREREVLDEGTGESFRVPVAGLPPYASMLVGPVWFGGQLIATLVVGWDRAHRLSADDARLLGAVDRYLSTQLAGALSTLRQQRTMELAEAGARLRELLLSVVEDEPTGDAPLLPEGEADEPEDAGKGVAPGQGGSGKDPRMGDDPNPQSQDVATGEGDAGRLPSALARCLGMLEDVLECRAALARESHWETESTELVFNGSVPISLPLELDDLLAEDEPFATIAPGEALARWLEEHDLPHRGAVVDAGTAERGRTLLLVLRASDEDPLDDLELAFIQRLGEDARDAARAGERRESERHISQALQTGMRNELQKVDGITAVGLYSSATQAAFVGGDFYDLIRLPKGRACVIMGDVSGKGVEAASVSAAVKTALGAYSWEGLRPARMVGLLNEFLLGFSRLETFATLFVGVIDVSTGQLTYCSAGHPPAIVCRAKTGELSLCSVQSGVVGAFSEMSYRNGRVRMAPGDILMLYTDGTTEARAQDGSFFGEEGLREALLAELPVGFDGQLDRLLARLDDFTGRRLDDDVAMVAVRYDGLG